MITYVWAEDKNGVIGKNGNLPWHLPADMHHFKKSTINHPILAGFKTYQSFGRPLPHRQNMVLTTHNKDEFPENVLVFNKISKFLDYYKQHNNDNICVVGGANIFKQLLPYADYLSKTEIDAEFNGDTYMPKIDYSKFKLVNTVQGKIDDNNKYSYQFKNYERIND